ncbi:hypothetical protein GDO81_005951 [Engystomops pustulosus]|nr:hypothetical protein GDO81_005951 [Engystomops pustulosus]KAG8588322.1 hypothetical protein GDO81_005951 [Engystomops pustulosus]
MPEDSALLSLHKSLRRCLDVIDEQQEEWYRALIDCVPLVNTLNNLVDQLLICERVNFSQTPLRGFSILHHQIFYKLEEGIDVTLEKLNRNVRILQGVRDAVSHHVGSVLHVYAVNADEINLETTLERTANSPSLADILEWLKDTEKFFRNQHLERKNLLYMGNDHLQDIRNLYNTWEKLNDLSSIRQNIVQGTVQMMYIFAHCCPVIRDDKWGT